MAATQNTEKICIQAFSDSKMSKRVGQLFYIPINPEQYSEKRQLKYDTKKGVGNQGTNPKFGAAEPEELKLDFTFDGTGAVEGNLLNGEDVPKQVKTFLETVYQMNGDIHKPHFLKLQWGEFLTFPCVMTSLDLTYTLFDKTGKPLRAKLSAVFLNYQEEEKRIRTEGKNSPDLTHERTVIEGSRLDLMTHEIYGNSRYMLQIARTNGLTSIRKIHAGRSLLFPPFSVDEKTETQSHLEP